MSIKSDPITPNQVNFFHENGYIQYKTFFSKEEIKPLSKAIDHAMATHRDRIKGAESGGRKSDTYELVFNQMVNLWTDYPEVKAINFNPRLSKVAHKLSKSREVRLYHDHALIKPAGQVSRETNWHQDAPYWPMNPAGAFSAWIAVDDVTLENGCLHFVPGSHNFGKQPPIKLDIKGESIRSQMKKKGHQVPEPVSMEMPAGGVTFHHGCTFHYAGPNKSHHPRRAFAIIYIPDYVRFTGGKEPAGADEEMEINGPWNHPLHPIIAPT